MNYKKALGLGILFWLIIFAGISAALPWYNKYSWMHIVAAVFSGAVSFILAGYMKLSDRKDALRCAVIWIAVGAVLDFFITRNFNVNIFSEWTLWLGYALAVGGVFLRAEDSGVDTEITKDEKQNPPTQIPV